MVECGLEAGALWTDLMTAEEIPISLPHDQTLVLFEWLARTGSAAEFEDQAEQRVLWDLEALLEKHLTDPFKSDYRERLDAARGRVRDSE